MNISHDNDSRIVSLEFAQALRELGAFGESAMYWARPHGFDWMLVKKEELDGIAPYECCPAYNADELLEVYKKHFKV